MTIKIRLNLFAFTALAVLLFATFAYVLVARADDGSDHGNTDATSTVTDVRDKTEDRRTDLQEKRDELIEKAEVKREELRENASGTRADFAERKEQVEEERAERRQQLDEKRKARIAAYAERIVRRMNAAIERLEKIADRIDSRIVKLEETIEGLSLLESKELLLASREALVGAASDMGAIFETMRSALDSDTPKEAFTEVRTLFSEAKQSLKDAHRALVEAIKSLKAARDLRVSDEVEEENSTTSESGDGE